MTTLLIFLLPFTIAISWIRLFGLGSHQCEGTPIGEMPLTLLARLYMHIVPIAVSILTAMLAATYGATGWMWVIAPIISGSVLVALPLRYTISEKGIRRSFGTFRRWTEFAGVERSFGGARLKPLPRTRPAHIWLSGSRGDDEFLHLLRTLIRNAYKGSADIPAFPGTALPPTEESSSHPAEAIGLAAYQECSPA